jgi:ABC-type oligopeptide transport system substrate-binding subunit
MNMSNRHLRLLAGSALITVSLVLAGCNQSAEESSPGAPDTSAAGATTNSSVANGGTPGAGEVDDEAEMRERHRQEMDHDEMRQGGKRGMGPQQGNTTAPQPSGNQAMPMDHM